MALNCTPPAHLSQHSHPRLFWYYSPVTHEYNFSFICSYCFPANFLIHFSVHSFSFLSCCSLACCFCSFAVSLEENASKSEESPPEKTVVKERILEKIDLSKGISFRWLHVSCLVLLNSSKQWCTLRYRLLLGYKLLVMLKLFCV